MEHTLLTGSCACSNIRFELELSRPSLTYHPRACDCDFCTKHMAAYISDPQGKIHLHITDAQQLNRYRQGTRLAEFFICKACGVLTNVIYSHTPTQLFASVNARTLDTPATFGEIIPVSPQTLSDAERITRWQNSWFNEVRITFTV